MEKQERKGRVCFREYMSSLEEGWVGEGAKEIIFDCALGEDHDTERRDLPIRGSREGIE